MQVMMQGQGGESLAAMTADATATSADILTGKTAYAAGEKLTGTAQAMKTGASITSQTSGLYRYSIESFNGTTLRLYTPDVIASKRAYITITLR